MIVVDASVLANVIGDDGADGRQARGELRPAGGVAAPDLVDVETVAVLRKRWLSGTISARMRRSVMRNSSAAFGPPVIPPIRTLRTSSAP